MTEKDDRLNPPAMPKLEGEVQVRPGVAKAAVDPATGLSTQVGIGPVKRRPAAKVPWYNKVDLIQVFGEMEDGIVIKVFEGDETDDPRVMIGRSWIPKDGSSPDGLFLRNQPVIGIEHIIEHPEILDGLDAVCALFHEKMDELAASAVPKEG